MTNPTIICSQEHFTIIYAAAAMAFLLGVFLRGGHYQIFFLGLVNGAVLAYCYCLRDAPRKAYHRSVTP